MTTTRTGWYEGKAVAYARDDMDMSQAELAEALTEATGIEWNQAKVSRIERGITPLTTPELRAIAKLQGRTWEWYFDGPNYDRFLLDSQRFLSLEGVNGLDVAVITKTDDEAAASGFRKRPAFLGGAVKNLHPAPVLSFETPRLDLEDDWLEVVFQKVG